MKTLLIVGAFLLSLSALAADSPGTSLAGVEFHGGKKYVRLRIVGEAAKKMCGIYGFATPSGEGFIESKNSATCGTDGNGTPYFGFLTENGSLRQLDLEAFGYN